MLSAVSLASLALILAAPQEGPRAELRPMGVDDVLDLVRLGDVRMSPDGEWVFYSERRASWEDNDYETRFFLIPSRGGTPREFLGEAGGHDFAFSPDGSGLTFLREVEGDPQLHLLPLDGGEARDLAAHPGGVDAYRWSPDGRGFFFTAERPLTARELEARKAGEDAVFVGEGPNGMDHGSWTDLWFLDLESAEATRLTDEALTIEDFDVSPDGRQVVFVGLRDNRTNYFHTSELYLLDVEDGEVRRLTENEAPEEGPRWAPDGRRIAYRAPDDRRFDLRNGYIWILDTESGEARRLEGQRQGEVGELFWTADGQRLLFDESHGLDTNLYALSVESDELEALTEWSGTVRSRAFSAERTRWVYSFEDFDTPPDLYAARPGGAEPVRLTRANPHVEQELLLGLGGVYQWKSPDGRSIEGVLLLPPDVGALRPRPLMLDIHGGPPGFWGNAFEPEHHLWTGLGWAVFAPNPRGSSSYGDEHLRALMGDVGGGELEDLLSGVDHLVERGVADPEHLALRGWSWGGILGAWTIAHTDRFRAASLGAMVGDWSAETGGGLMYDLALHYIGCWPWEDPEEWLRRSPLTHVSKVTTPTLLLHGERDDVSTVNQSAMFYTALRGLGVPVRFLRFPRQGHDLREPRSRRLAAVEEIRWMARHVLGER